MKGELVLIIAAACFALPAGCTREQVYRNLYEGTTTHQRLQDPEGPGTEPIRYDRYRTLREEQH